MSEHGDFNECSGVVMAVSLPFVQRLIVVKANYSGESENLPLRESICRSGAIDYATPNPDIFERQSHERETLMI